jgi:hypothetical protein
MTSRLLPFFCLIEQASSGAAGFAHLKNRHRAHSQ